MIQQHLKLLSGDAVRSSRFHRKFLQMFCIELALDLGQQTVQLIRLQRGRCAAADIDGVQFFIPEPVCHIVQLLTQCIQILIHLLPPPLQRIGRERTIQTDAWTERNAHIEAVSVFVINISKHIPFPVGDHDT